MMFAVLLALAATGGATATAPSAAAEPGLTDEARDAKIAAVRGLSVNERMAAVSELFLGTPYVLSPLGEGEGRDADPLIRYDAVDCVTMVEEVMAMSLAPDAASRLVWLNRIRYQGAPAWEHRKHVMEAQWLPQNSADGLLVDVTSTYGGPATKKVTKVLTRSVWREKSGASLALPEASEPVGTFALTIVPAADAVKLLSKAPSGLLVVVVRADRPKAVTRVSHVGVLVQTPSGPVLRHASRSYKKVTDELLAHYLTRNLDFAKWTVEGLALFEVREP